MTTPDIAGLCERLRAVESSRVHGGFSADCATTHWHRNPDGPEAADTLERQAAEIERLRDSAAKTFADVVFLRKDYPGQSEQFYAEEASSLCRRALAALTGEDTATLSLSDKNQTKGDACTS